MVERALLQRKKVNQIFDPVLSVDVTKTKHQRLVYLLVANKPVWYGRDYSRILYIGTTMRGLRRIAGSASWQVSKLEDDPKLKGIKRIDAYVVWTANEDGEKKIRGRSSWHALETALLVKFKELYGEQPKLNVSGKRFGKRQQYVFDLFSAKTIERIVRRYC